MISMRLGRAIKWDPVAEQIVGDVEASNLMMPSERRLGTLLVPRSFFKEVIIQQGMRF